MEALGQRCGCIWKQGPPGGNCITVRSLGWALVSQESGTSDTPTSPDCLGHQKPKRKEGPSFHFREDRVLQPWIWTSGLQSSPRMRTPLVSSLPAAPSPEPAGSRAPSCPSAFGFLWAWPWHVPLGSAISVRSHCPPHPAFPHRPRQEELPASPSLRLPGVSPESPRAPPAPSPPSASLHLTRAVSGLTPQRLPWCRVLWPVTLSSVFLHT